MSARRQRTVTIAAFVAALAVMVTAAIVLRERIEERYRIHRLGSTDREVVRAAAERLVELRSLRALPALLRALAGDERFAAELSSSASVLENIEAWKAREGGYGFWASELVRGLEDPNARGEAIEKLVRALGDEDPAVVVAAADALAELGPSARASAPEILAAVGRLLVAERRIEEVRRLPTIRFVGDPVRPVAAPDSAREVLLQALRNVLPETVESCSFTLQHLPAGVQDAESIGWDIAARVRHLSDEARERDIDGLLALFEDNDSERRLAALAASQALDGLQSPAAVRAVARCLADEHPEVRYAAAGALPEKPQLLATVAAELHTRLRDDNAWVRTAALEYLGSLPEGAALAAREIARLLADPAPEVRTAAAEALEDLGSRAAAATPELLATLRDRVRLAELGSEQWRLRGSALRALRRIGKDAPDPARVVEALAAIAADPKDEMRLAAVQALGAFGPAAAPALPHIIEFAEGSLAAAAANDEPDDEPDDEPPERRPDDRLERWLCALDAVLRIGGNDSPQLARLVARFLEVAREGTGEVLDPAASLSFYDGGEIAGFGRLGMRASTLAPVLERLAAVYDDGSEIANFVGPLASVAPAAPGAVSIVADVWRRALESRPALRFSDPPLIRYEGEEYNRVLLRALVESARDSPLAAEAAGELAAIVTGEAPHARRLAFLRAGIVAALGRLGADPERSVPALARALTDEDWRVRVRAAEALGDFGIDARGAGEINGAKEGGTPALLRALADDADPRVRAAAARSLGSIGELGAEGVSALAKALGDRYASVRRAAAWALGEIGPEAAGGDHDAVGALLRGLGDGDLEVRRGAVEALGKLGPAAHRAAAALRSAAVDTSLRIDARRALARLGES